MRRLVVYTPLASRNLWNFILRQNLPPVLDPEFAIAAYRSPSYYYRCKVFPSPDGSKMIGVTGASDSAGTDEVWLISDTSQPTNLTNPVITSFGGYLYDVTCDDTHYAACGSGSTKFYVARWEDQSLVSSGWDKTGLGECYSISIYPDGSRVAVTHRTSPYLRVYNIADGTYQEPQNGVSDDYPYGCAVTRDGKYIVVVAGGSPYLTVFDAVTLDRVHIETSRNFYSGQRGQCQANPYRHSCVVVCKGRSSSSDHSTYEFDTATMTTKRISHVDHRNVYHPGAAFDPVNNMYYYITGGTKSNARFHACKADDFSVDNDWYQVERAFLWGWYDYGSITILERDCYRITGTVRDINNNPAEREVLAYHRKYEVLMAKTKSDPTTGDYTLYLPDAGPYDVQFKTAEGELLNDLFFSRTEPEPVDLHAIFDTP